MPVGKGRDGKRAREKGARQSERCAAARGKKISGGTYEHLVREWKNERE